MQQRNSINKASSGMKINYKAWRLSAAALASGSAAAAWQWHQ